MRMSDLAPLAPVLGGEGSREGDSHATPPHPQPLSPEYRGEGSKTRTPSPPTPLPRVPGRGGKADRFTGNVYERFSRKEVIPVCHGGHRRDTRNRCVATNARLFFISLL